MIDKNFEQDALGTISQKESWEIVETHGKHAACPDLSHSPPTFPEHACPALHKLLTSFPHSPPNPQWLKKTR